MGSMMFEDSEAQVLSGERARRATESAAEIAATLRVIALVHLRVCACKIQE